MQPLQIYAASRGTWSQIPAKIFNVLAGTTSLSWKGQLAAAKLGWAPKKKKKSRSTIPHCNIGSFAVLVRTSWDLVLHTVPEDCSSVTRLSGTFFASCSHLVLVPMLPGQKRVCTQGRIKLSRAYSNSVPRECFIFDLYLGASWFLKTFKLTFSFVSC